MQPARILGCGRGLEQIQFLLSLAITEVNTSICFATDIEVVSLFSRSRNSYTVFALIPGEQHAYHYIKTSSQYLDFR